MSINFLHSGMICSKLIYKLRLSVIYTLKIFSRSDRPVYRTCSYAEHIFYLIQELKRISRLSVKLVYKCKYRYLSHYTDLKKFYSLCFNTLTCIYYHDCRICRHQSSVCILREILMSRCIQNIYTKSVIVKLHNR